MSVIRIKTRVFHPIRERLEADLVGEECKIELDFRSTWRYRQFRSKDIEFIDEYENGYSLILYYDGRMFLAKESDAEIFERFKEAVSDEYYEEEEEGEESDDGEENG